jgi:hypothetical protein
MNVLVINANQVKTISSIVIPVEEYLSEYYDASKKTMTGAMIIATLKRKYPKSTFKVTLNREYQLRDSKVLAAYVLSCEFGSNKEFNKFKLIEGFNQDGSVSTLSKA